MHDDLKIFDMNGNETDESVETIDHREMRFVKYKGRWYVANTIVLDYMGEYLVKVFDPYDLVSEFLDWCELDAFGPKVNYPV